MHFCSPEHWNLDPWKFPIHILPGKVRPLKFFGHFIECPVKKCLFWSWKPWNLSDSSGATMQQTREFVLTREKNNIRIRQMCEFHELEDNRNDVSARQLSKSKSGTNCGCIRHLKLEIAGWPKNWILAESGQFWTPELIECPVNRIFRFHYQNFKAGAQGYN